MLNPFFLQGSSGEQNLVQDLINEQIRMYGIEIYYMPRKYLTTNTVIREVIESKFDSAYPIEAYVSSYDGYGGQGTLLSKFGIQDIDDLTLVISKERFENYISPLLEDLPGVELTTRPKEGDLIYFPLGDRVFEIKYVEHESPFYQLQKNYVYELRCELFRYGDEIVDTSFEEIDDNFVDQAYTRTFTMVGAGETASAIASVVNGGVQYFTVTNRGSDYTSSPSVTVSSSPSSGGNAVGIATLLSGIFNYCIVDKEKSVVQGIEVANSGFGYTSNPAVSLFGGGGSGAKATATIGDGVVGIITVTNGGSGYIVPPTVTVVGIASTSAEAVAVLTNGSVTSIRLKNAGFGYTEAPTIQISDPYLVGVGTYRFNEVVIGSSSSTTAYVESWNVNTKQLELKNITGDFVSGEVIIGQESGANYKITKITVEDLDDAYAQNIDIEQEADKILDFTEKNPFGTP
jgi:hypothetical protein